MGKVGSVDRLPDSASDLQLIEGVGLYGCSLNYLWWKNHQNGSLDIVRRKN